MKRKPKNSKSDTPKKLRKAPVRTCFGRLKGVEVPGRERVLVFELTKAGVVFRERGTRKARATVLSFERLANCGMVAAKVGEQSYSVALVPAGVEVKRQGSKDAATVVPWERIINESVDEPYLWPDLCRYGPERLAVSRTEAAA